jgi:hypothetical protein
MICQGTFGHTFVKVSLRRNAQVRRVLFLDRVHEQLDYPVSTFKSGVERRNSMYDKFTAFEFSRQ